MPVPPAGGQVAGRVQDEGLAWSDLPDDECAPGLRWPVRDEVADTEILQLGNDARGTGPVGGEQQAVPPSCCVPAATVPAHLHEPRPHALGRPIDRDGVIGDDLRTGDDTVPGQPPRALLRCGAVGPAQPDEGDLAEGRRHHQHHDTSTEDGSARPHLDPSPTRMSTGLMSPESVAATPSPSAGNPSRPSSPRSETTNCPS